MALKIKKKKVKYLMGAAAIVLIASAYLLFSQGQGNYDSFAKCLKSKKVTLYTSKYCPHCNTQKEMFGDSVSFLNNIDCIDQQEKCTRAGIEAVPTWVIRGIKTEGIQELETLSTLTGCSLV